MIAEGRCVTLRRCEKNLPSKRFRKSTAELGLLSADGGPLPGLADGNSGRVVLFGGGVPLFDGPDLLGGFGVSGGTVEEDCDIVGHAIQSVMGEHS